MDQKRASLFHFTDREIKTFFRSGKRLYRHDLGDVLILPKRYDYSRVIVIIAKRIVAKATHRNRIRRQIKAIFYENRLFEGPSDFMVIIKSDGSNASFEDLKNFLLSAAKKNAQRNSKKK